MVKCAVLGNDMGIIIIISSADSFSKCVWDEFQTKATISVSLTSEYLKAELNFAQCLKCLLKPFGWYWTCALPEEEQSLISS